MWAKSQDFLISFAPQTKLIWQKNTYTFYFESYLLYTYCKILPSEIEQDNMPPMYVIKISPSF
jgi:hypothetical protein